MSNKMSHLAQSLANDVQPSSDDLEHLEKMLGASKLEIIAKNTISTQPILPYGLEDDEFNNRLQANLFGINPESIDLNKDSPASPDSVSELVTDYWRKNLIIAAQFLEQKPVAPDEVIINFVVRIRKSK